MAYVSRGGIWSLKKEHDKAITDFTEAIRLDPKDAEVYMDRGDAWTAKASRRRPVPTTDRPNS